MASTPREKYFFHNSLAILLRVVENERTTIDLRNEASVYGTVEHADAYMNVVMKDCIFTDPRGDAFEFESFFVQARNIRFVHIPIHISIIPAIKTQLKTVTRKYRPSTTSLRSKRARAIQAVNIVDAQKMLENKNKTTRDDGNDT